jgi:hypothetical protein
MSHTPNTKATHCRQGYSRRKPVGVDDHSQHILDRAIRGTVHLASREINVVSNLEPAADDLYTRYSQRSARIGFMHTGQLFAVLGVGDRWGVLEQQQRAGNFYGSECHVERPPP